MQGIPDNLGNGTVIGKYDIGHACGILVQKRSKHAALQCLHKRRKTSNVSEKCRDFPALALEIDGLGVVGKTLSKVRRKISRQRGISPLRRRLPLTGLTQKFDVADGLSNRGFQIEKIDRLGYEIKGASI